MPVSELESAGITGVQLNWFPSYLLWNVNLSNPPSLNKGVPQGSILGQNLFLTMIYNMPLCVTRKTQTTSLKVVGYADDTTVFVKSDTIEKKSLQEI